ncbi:homocysteine S-methyltransferase [Amycolatopsis palatopharyngis]|uniref:homocysteine S-methyltransferase n=1 Tax=Amycolatopsis palatopharyngis TaxID=187982 RepID=UPI000E27A1E0|nr:homocysteine S-methyltransferase [Amycolatopsis palatopharyngis]
MPDTFEQALAAPGAPLVLDGGLATELEARGNDLSGTLWSARLLRDAPEEVVAAHAAFFTAGADIAITASYQASFSGFAAAGIGHDETVSLLRRSVEVARQARDQLPGDGRPRWIAASVGPYGAALADGSEYRGRYGLGAAELADFHRARLEVLADSGADLLALETVPDQDEAVALLSALDGLGVPVWLSYTVEGGRTRAGQPLEEAFAVAAEHEDVVAVGVNCCAPAEVLPAAEVARRVTGKPVIAYPNSGETWDAAGRRWTGHSEFDVDLRDWIAAGVQIAGGCCRVGPAQISAIAARLSECCS